ncbi:S8 family peptidase [Paracoccus litorisediminis]|uniref:S8 family peptidase n=1 Tax=Paracoccus litorisediminis TaxID=2006130 RepID=UPI0037321C45
MRRSPLFRVLMMTTVIGLAACKSDGSGSGDIAGGAGGGSGHSDFSNALGGWFVTEFDMADLRRIRETLPFIAQNLKYHITVQNHPRLDGSEVISSNAYREIGLDYARSVGLTGKGVTLAMIDSGIYLDHDEFAGRDITIMSGSANNIDYHGTAVGGIAAGMNGVAPDASLISGVIDYSSGADLSQYASFVRQADAAGALALNNSWTIGGSAQHSNALSGASGQSYINALKDYAEGGIVIFAASNGYQDNAAHLMAALPSLHPELEESWLTVINAIPTMEGDDVTSAIRVSAACLDAAAWCLAANGQINLPVHDAGMPDPGAYDIGNGASYAAPQAAGSLALLAEAFPTLTAQELRARLLVTANNGFFEAEDSVTFAPGLSHGYNTEFGHGFIDLKAALLPIGSTAMPTATGDRKDLGEMALISGGASGDAIVKALVQEKMIVSDQMAGTFEISAANIAATSLAVDDNDMAERMAGFDPGSFRRARAAAAAGDMDLAMRMPALMSLEENRSIGLAQSLSLVDRDGYSLDAFLARDDSGDFGFSGKRSFSRGNAGLELGLEAARENGSIMGVNGASEGPGSEHLAITAGFALPVSARAMIRLDGSYGQASGGEIADFVELGAQSFNSFGASLSFADMASPGDVLTLFARQPVAVSSGSAEISIARPSRSSAGGVDYAPLSVDLAPSARQVDIGFEYLRQLGDGGDLAFAYRHVENHGNVSGRTDDEFGVTFAHRF